MDAPTSSLPPNRAGPLASPAAVWLYSGPRPLTPLGEETALTTVAAEHRTEPQTAAPTDEVDLEGLKDLSAAELRRLWAREVPRQDPPRAKTLLVRELAWRRQQRAHGGPDAETRRLLKAAVRQAARPADAAKATRRARPNSKPKLPTGTKLVRTWGGVEHEVTVLEDGKRFEYRGETYRSLSQIARAVTGAHWSGPRFFGLHR